MKQHTTMTPDEKEAYHRESESRIRAFDCKMDSAATDRVSLVNSKLVKLMVRTVRDGAERKLRYHTNSETIWIVQRGGARFYGVGGKLLAELAPGEGILLPGGSRYWFEKSGPDELELLQMIAVGSTDDDDPVAFGAHDTLVR